MMFIGGGQFCYPDHTLFWFTLNAIGQCFFIFKLCLLNSVLVFFIAIYEFCGLQYC